MPVKTVFETKIEHLSILDENGNFDAKLGKGLIPDKDAVKLYEQLQMCRHNGPPSMSLTRSSCPVGFVCKR